MPPLSRAASVFLAGTLVAACSKDAPPPPQRPAPQVTVVTVKPQSVPYIATFVAQTESSRQVDIVARVSGYLDRIDYREGELVKEGDVLFRIDPKPFQAQLESAQGELKAQEARHSTAFATLNRIKPLTEMRAMSQADLDKAQGEFDSSRAAEHFMIRQIEIEIANAQVEWRLFSKTAAQGADTGDQFLHGKWFGQIIIRAELQARDTILDLGAGGEHQDTARNVARTQPTQDFKPVHSWQPNIEHDQVERRLRGIAQCGFTIVSHDRIMAGFDQRGSDLSRQSNFIFNNQSAHKL